ncbi:FAD-dependent monooxygenase [Pseudomonas rhodesiae]|uniref:FAD-dependent monooxygenase n=1 Tax=Pseudomonas rhodesiae TaxID=76760 RepID=UPI000F468BF0|nr:FAD-dependent monooxygenase [Pseudomonas rhodesiae]ROM50797.1 hypothetical protein BK650_19325 [Pseudomonas rhodesiae]ROM61439.1 hypothetical protein BK651_23525 [Pseudomonas rhodesiae]
MNTSVAIAGGGIGGLTAAIAFAQRGADVTVYEQSKVLGEIGAGIQMSPNAMKVLTALGVSTEVREIAFEPEFGAMRHWKNGTTYFRPNVKSQCRLRYNAPYYHVHRADLHAILVKRARVSGVDVKVDTAITGYEQDGETAWLQTRLGQTERADLVIGADGIKSAIRTQMHGIENPRFTGAVAWRGLLPTSSLPKGLVKPGATIWLGPQRHVVTYYVRGGELVNFIAVEDRDDWHNESWTEKGDVQELRRKFQGWHPEVSMLVDAVEETFVWALFDRDELPSWSDRRVVLLGDACHPTLPSLSQGAAMAIEDGYVLASLCEKHGVIAAPALYEAERKPRTTKLQRLARHMTGIYHLNGGFRDTKLLWKFRMGRLLPESYQLKPLDGIYGYDATAVGY